jgi:hypothetical protein
VCTLPTWVVTVTFGTGSSGLIVPKCRRELRIGLLVAGSAGSKRATHRVTLDHNFWSGAQKLELAPLFSVPQESTQPQPDALDNQGMLKKKLTYSERSNGTQQFQLRVGKHASRRLGVALEVLDLGEVKATLRGPGNRTLTVEGPSDRVGRLAQASQLPVKGSEETFQ